MSTGKKGHIFTNSEGRWEFRSIPLTEPLLDQYFLFRIEKWRQANASTDTNRTFYLCRVIFSSTMKDELITKLDSTGINEEIKLYVVIDEEGTEIAHIYWPVTVGTLEMHCHFSDKEIRRATLYLNRFGQTENKDLGQTLFRHINEKYGPLKKQMRSQPTVIQNWLFKTEKSD